MAAEQGKAAGTPPQKPLHMAAEAEAIARRLESAYAALAQHRAALAAAGAALHEFGSALDAAAAHAERHGAPKVGRTHGEALRALVALGAAPREPAPLLSALPRFPSAAYDTAFCAATPSAPHAQQAAARANGTAAPGSAPGANGAPEPSVASNGGGADTRAEGAQPAGDAAESLTIAGTCRMGETLSALLDGGAHGLRGRVLQWYRRGADGARRGTAIVGATGPCLLLTAEEAGLLVRVELFARGTAPPGAGKAMDEVGGAVVVGEAAAAGAVELPAAVRRAAAAAAAAPQRSLPCPCQPASLLRLLAFISGWQGSVCWPFCAVPLSLSSLFS